MRSVEPPTKAAECSLQHPEFEPGFLAHQLRRPGRGPDELDANVADAGDAADRRLDFPRHRGGYRTGGSRQRHLDIDDAPFLDDQLVNETELDKIHRDFRIAHRLQRFEDRSHQRRIVFPSARPFDLLVGGGRVWFEVEWIANHLPTPSS